MDIKWEDLCWQDRVIRTLQLVLIPITIAVVGWYVSLKNETGKIEAEKIKAATEYVGPFFASVQSLREAREKMRSWAFQQKAYLNLYPSPDFSVGEFKGEYTIEQLCKRLLSVNLAKECNSVAGLNNLLGQDNLYIKIKKFNNSHTPTKHLYDLEKTYHGEKTRYNLKKLNRITLEEFYPQETPKSNLDKLLRQFEFASGTRNTRYRHDELVDLCRSINSCEEINSFVRARQDAINKVLALAGYGETAIPFLISILEDEDVEIRKLATDGFELISNTSGGKDAVGLALINILKNETHLYSWFTHESAILILGWIDFRNAECVISDFSKKLDEKYWERAFDSKDAYTKENEESLKASISKSLNHLRH